MNIQALKNYQGTHISWHDPEPDFEHNCSKTIEIKTLEVISEEMISIVGMDGGHLECPPHELDENPPQYVHTFNVSIETTSPQKNQKDISPEFLRAAIIARANSITDEEIHETCYFYDTRMMT